MCVCVCLSVWMCLCGEVYEEMSRGVKWDVVVGVTETMAYFTRLKV